MKRTLTINLGGLAFTIDDDAYNRLQDYLKKTEEHFPDEEDREILSDIEIRISELFTERLGKHREVVDCSDVDYVIQTLGSPEQYDDEPADSATDSKQSRSEKRAHRKFYRDTDNQILGGVAAGIAAYLGWDVTLVRLLLIIVLILGFGYIIPAYLIVWLIAPEAKTTSQKLEMKGVEPSIENMRKYMESEQFQSSASRIGTRLGQIFIWLFRFAAIIVGITLASLGVLIVGIIIYALIAAMVTGSFATISTLVPALTLTPTLFTTITISMLTCVVIPIVAIIGSTIRLLRRDKNPLEHKHTVWGWIWFAVWIVAVITLLVSLTVSAKDSARLFDFDSLASQSYDITEKSLVGAEFDKLQVSDAIMVSLVHDSIGYIEISGNEYSLRNTKAEIIGTTLTLSSTRNVTRFMDIQRPMVVVHYTDLQTITADSYSSVDNVGTLYADNLSLAATSASNIDLNVECKRLDVKAESASKVELGGRADNLLIECTSVSEVDADDLHATNATVTGTSTSDVDVRADTVNLTATSMSEITHNADAVVKSSTTNSMGTIEKNR